MEQTCVRCGYGEFGNSVHRHHIDEDHENNLPTNILHLCANCHMAYHKGRWKLSELHIEIPNYRLIRSIKDTKEKRPNRNTQEKQIISLLKETESQKSEIIRLKALLNILPDNERFEEIMPDPPMEPLAYFTKYMPIYQEKIMKRAWAQWDRRTLDQKYHTQKS